MVQIYNSDLLKGMQEDAALQVSNGIPSQLADKIVPVMEVNPKFFKLNNLFVDYSRSTTATTVAAYTFSSTSDTYITGIHFQNQSDVACDNNTMLVYVATEKGNSYIYRANKLSLTEFNVDTYIQFVNPIKILKGSTVAFTNAFTVGASTSTIQIFGYTTENPKA